MIIELINLESSPYQFDFVIEPAAIDLDGETFELKNSVRVAGELKTGIVQTDIAGEISADVLLECTRCLQPVERRLDFNFEAAFVTPENYTAAKEAELNASDLNVAVFDGNRIDLTELVREQILLNLPEQVFCGENCLGLCEKCGTNRNLSSCDCDKNETDPRWAALKNLK